MEEFGDVVTWRCGDVRHHVSEHHHFAKSSSGLWFDADDAAVRAVIRETDHAGDLRKQRVVLAEADVEARLVASPALPHENRSARHEVAVEPLHAEALRVAVAAVSRASLTFFVCHD